MLTVSINGQRLQLDDRLTIAELLSYYWQTAQHGQKNGQSNKKVAVAVNGEFVPRSQYTQARVNNNDEIDIVTAVGGG
jgi:sulfur carrier protein